MTSLLIVGAGGHGLVVADAAERSGRWREIFFLDDHPDKHHCGTWEVVGTLSALAGFPPDRFQVAVAIGHNATRCRVLQGLVAGDYRTPPIIHPAAVVSDSATVGEGSVVFAGAILNALAVIGVGCILNTACTVDHECVIQRGVHISPGAHLAGGVTVGELSWIGMGVSIIQGRLLGRDVVVGAGSVVLHDLPDGSRVVGVPARPIVLERR